jgi:hypothetical protein
MKTLHLTLTRKWFKMVLSGEKKDEYREIKPYWMKRFMRCFWAGFRPCKYGCCWDTVGRGCPGVFNDFDTIEFRNGYAKDAPIMLVECKDIITGVGRPEWGAPTEPVFILKLGAVLETRNCEKLKNELI